MRAASVARSFPGIAERRPSGDGPPDREEIADAVILSSRHGRRRDAGLPARLG
jgi:hypothetical protein